ncbi:MAG: ABC transporter permease, partial [Bacteroidales bacterium]|nr:ABC transporter permease [Bacteroidales bacterium]
ISKVFRNKLFSLLVMLVGVALLFAVWANAIGTTFLSTEVLLSIGSSMTTTSFMAIGAGMLLVAGHMDFSVAAVGALSCVSMAACIKYLSMPTGFAIIVALAAGALCGLLNGVLVNEFNFDSFIATLASSFVITGITQVVSLDPSKGAAIPQTINVSNSVTNFIGTYKIGGAMPIGLLLALVAFVIYGIILSRTKFGKEMYLVGGNPRATELTGIRSKRVIYILFANSGLMSAMAGVLYMCRSGLGDLTALQANQYTGLTAAILGGIAFGGGSGNMLGVFMGILILSTFNIGTVTVRFSGFLSTVLTGILLLIALLLDTLSKRARAKKVNMLSKSEREGET